MEDGRWPHTLLNWTSQGTRRQAHPFKRWTDDLDTYSSQGPFSAGGWRFVGQSRQSRADLEDDFVEYGK